MKREETDKEIDTLEAQEIANWNLKNAIKTFFLDNNNNVFYNTFVDERFCRSGYTIHSYLISFNTVIAHSRTQEYFDEFKELVQKCIPLVKIVRVDKEPTSKFYNKRPEIVAYEFTII